MKKIINLLKNAIVLSIIGLICFSILLWFIGPQLKFGEANTAPLASVAARLIAIIIIVVLWGLNNLRIQLKNKKQNQGLVEDLEQNQQQNAKDLNTEQSQQEVNQISQRFTQALATLKITRFSGVGKNKALYELPWYIIIGPPGSGKTTALVNSTLDFPLADKFGKGALQGVGGTRNCDWWFTNDAVLVDTAGRYTTQDSHKVIDSSAWEGFLNILKKNRTRRPINGAIIAISLQDILTQSEEERLAHAKTIRTRIDELMEKLEIRFPIYLMFTKSDLIAGFSEFFEDLGKEEREQVWGVTLPNAALATENPDFEFFDKQYNALLQRLYDRVLWKVHQERDVNRRGTIQGFPQQMENLQSIVGGFLRQTFSKNRYQFQPYLRGVYFSSGTQDGTPIDRLMTSVVSGFGFSREVAQKAHQQGKSYFLGNLFKQVIFPESELVGSNRRYEQFIFWGRKVAFVGMIAFAISLIGVWSASMTQHSSYMSEVESYIQEYKTESKGKTSQSKDVRKTLPALNSLLKASSVYDKEAHPWLSSMGLYDDNLDSTADNAYQQSLKKIFLPKLVSYLASSISQGHSGGDLYNSFRIYLMFNQVERMDSKLVSEWFTANFTQHFKGEATNRNQLILHLNNLLSLDLEPTELNQILVNNTRKQLLRVPVSQRIYGRIRSNPEYAQTINLQNLFGESATDIFDLGTSVSEDLSIPWMFTYEGYQSIDFSPQSEIISGIINDRWVLSDDNSTKTDFMESDLPDISKQVKEHYLSEYLAVWKSALASLRVKPFTDLTHATEVLATLTDPVYSPLLSILNLVKENTELVPPLPEELPTGKIGGKTKKISGLLAKKLNTDRGTKVDRQFQSLNLLLRESSSRPAAINQTVQSIQQLYDFLDAIAQAPQPNKQAFDISKARFQTNAPNALTQLESKANKLPGPLKDWIEELADQSWKVIISSSHSYLNEEWKSQVYTPFSRGLVNSYPLNKRSKNDLAIIDFSDFFKPQGTLDKFTQDFISPFVDTRSWKSKVISGRQMALSDELLKQLRKAAMIKKVFFNKNPAVPSMSFQLRPDSMNKQDARFTLELGEQKVSYSHGPKFWKNLTWSGEDDLQRVRLVFEDLKGNFHTKTYTGPWSWFRLQDEAKLKRSRTAKNYRMTYAVKQKLNSDSGRSMSYEHKIDYLIKAKSVNNSFNNNLLGAFRCPASI